MSDFTPTTENVREATVGRFAMRHDEFDRWLSAHDAEVAAQALNDAADDVDLYGTTSTVFEAEQEAERQLRDRAARVARGEAGQ